MQGVCGRYFATCIMLNFSSHARCIPRCAWLPTTIPTMQASTSSLVAPVTCDRSNRCRHPLRQPHPLVPRCACHQASTPALQAATCHLVKLRPTMCLSPVTIPAMQASSAPSCLPEKKLRYRNRFSKVNYYAGTQTLHDHPSSYFTWLGQTIFFKWIVTILQ